MPDLSFELNEIKIEYEKKLQNKDKEIKRLE